MFLLKTSKVLEPLLPQEGNICKLTETFICAFMHAINLQCSNKEARIGISNARKHSVFNRNSTKFGWREFRFYNLKVNPHFKLSEKLFKKNA